MQHPQPTQPLRRGNTMVLVVGILALLVIVATGYVTRTHSGRLTAASQRQAVLREDNAEIIGGTIATEIAEALFVRPVDPIAFPPGTTPPSADTPRIALQPLDLTGDGVADYVPVRYGADPFDVIDNASGAAAPDGVPDRPYNFAPYAVYPWTNWPDEPFGVLPVGVWPRGPGAPSGLDQIVTPLGNVEVGEGNPAGSPGYGDTRWLACLEPARRVVGGAFGDHQAFSHWTHMSYLAAPHNGWRLVTDISDVFGHDLNPGGGLLMDLDVPVEQWLPFSPILVNPVTGVSHYGQATFMPQWLNWFDFTQHGAMYANFTGPPELTPPANFYDLSDLNGNDIHQELGERPQDEFIAGRARWDVSRVLADSDGDGFTDSFWFLAPTVIEGGVRQLVAVRIIDNASMLNANAATRFVRADRVTGRAATSGATPSDLALAGDVTDPLYLSSVELHTGFFDDPQHHEVVADTFDEFGDTTLGWNASMWPDLSSSEEITFLGELGLLLPDGSTHPDFPEYLHSLDERLRYWQFGARDPETASGGLTPFTLADELELRMFFGQNVPWTASRFERAVQANVRSEFITFPGDSLQLLHGNLRRVETSEYIVQLANRELVQDSRHRLTLFSGARNDVMPPWLWPEPYAVDYDLDGVVDLDDLREFRLRTRKYDLRYPWTFTGGVPNLDVDRDGVANELIPGGSPLDDDINDDTLIDERDHRALLARHLAAALGVNDNPRGAYFDDPAMSPDEEVELTERLAASYAANVDAWTDADDIPLALQDEAVAWTGPGGENYRYTGVEGQLCLVEAFIAHVHAGFEPADFGYSNLPGQIFFFRGLPNRSIVVVQLANPFDHQVNPTNFKVRVFGETVDLATAGIPMLLDPGEAMTLYSIPSELDDEPFKAPWVAELRLSGAPNALDVTGSWSDQRDGFDGSTSAAVELLQTVPLSSSGGTVDIVVDRMDIEWQSSGATDTDFQDEVAGLSEDALPDADAPPPPPGPWVDGVQSPPSTHWVQWGRATRAWHTAATEPPNLVNPRFVFAGREVRSVLDSPEGFDGDFVQLDAGVILGFDVPDDGGDDGVSGPNWFVSRVNDAGPVNLELQFALQTLRKNGDFEQLGEMANVWLFGHELEVDPGGMTYTGTHLTWSEYMWDEVSRLANNADKVRVNRLRARPAELVGGGSVGPVLGHTGSSILEPADPLHGIPDVPAGARVFDAFVCDGPGIHDSEFGTFELLLADAFSGRATTGLINVNTAPPEVMRAVPHGSRLTHETLPPTDNPFVRFGEAVLHYRERYNGNDADLSEPLPSGYVHGPDYAADRGAAEVRGERGLASLGELMLLDKPATAPTPGTNERNEAWQIDFPALTPFGVVESAQISTDLVDNYDPLQGQVHFDKIAEDAEERNLLFAGMSNLVTVRSDVFTVYFKVRSFRQNPATGIWNALDPEQIVDDSRYVMLVDRSQVDAPTDQPRILYLEKLVR